MKDLLCLCIDVSHHKVKSAFTFLPNMVQCIDMAMVYIQVCICGELCDLLFTSAPLVESSIQLANGKHNT